MQRIQNVGSFIVQFPSTEDVEVINNDVLDVTDYAKKAGTRFIQQDARKGILFDYESIDAIYCSCKEACQPQC